MHAARTANNAPTLRTFAAVFVKGAVCVGFAYRVLVWYVGRERTHEAYWREAGRREGAQLAARTLRHQLANKLSAAVGYSELLAEDPRLPQDLEAQVQRIRASAIAAVSAVDRFQHDILRIEVDRRVAGPTLLDLEASTAAEPPADLQAAGD
jgi:signal transduction histidine kinase